MPDKVGGEIMSRSDRRGIMAELRDRRTMA